MMRLLLTALLTLAVAAPAQATDWTQLRVLNIAHQGGEDEAPSNTMYAYERSLRIGADMLELDVHTDADGVLVAMHDATVDRTTNGTGRVYDMTLEELQKLDAGHNLVPGEGTESGLDAGQYPYRGVRLGKKKPPPGFTPDDFRIPTLDQVMRRYPNVPINIEIKGASDEDVDSFLRNAEALAAYLNELGRTRRDHGRLLQRPGASSASTSCGAADRPGAGDRRASPATSSRGVAPPEGVRAFQVPLVLRRRRRRGRAVHRRVRTPTATASTCGRSTTRPRCGSCSTGAPTGS